MSEFRMLNDGRWMLRMAHKPFPIIFPSFSHTFSYWLENSRKPLENV